TKPQAESGEAERSPSLRPARTVLGIKVTTVQQGTKAPEELVALQERSRPASEETLVPFHGSTLRNEATPRQKLEEEAGRGRRQASQSLERWPL
ncbi:hypothetical protein H8957_017660, partial [Semnopithecus entellus]